MEHSLHDFWGWMLCKKAVQEQLYGGLKEMLLIQLPSFIYISYVHIDLGWCIALVATVVVVVLLAEDSILQTEKAVYSEGKRRSCFHSYSAISWIVSSSLGLLSLCHISYVKCNTTFSQAPTALA
jgi:hypothetical protein